MSGRVVLKMLGIRMPTVASTFWLNRVLDKRLGKVTLLKCSGGIHARGRLGEPQIEHRRLTGQSLCTFTC